MTTPYTPEMLQSMTGYRTMRGLRGNPRRAMDCRVDCDQLIGARVQDQRVYRTHDEREAAYAASLCAVLGYEARDARDARRAAVRAKKLNRVLAVKQLRAGEEFRGWSVCGVAVIDGAPGVEYSWSWNKRSAYQRRHNYSGGGRETLEISAPRGKYTVLRTGKRVTGIRVGPWAYTKQRGHSFSVVYAPQGAQTDFAAFAAEENVERRRAILTACGIGILGEVTPIQQDDYGRLYETPVGRYVRVVCPSTDRVYLLRVPPDTATAKQAVAWTFGLSEVVYSPTLQR